MMNASDISTERLESFRDDNFYLSKDERSALVDAELDRRRQAKVEPCELPRDCDKCWWFDDQCPDGSDNHDGKCKNWKKAYQPPKPAPTVRAIEPLMLPPVLSVEGDISALADKLNETIEAVNRLTEWKRNDEALMEYALTHSPEEVVAETKRIFADRLTAGKE